LLSRHPTARSSICGGPSAAAPPIERSAMMTNAGARRNARADAVSAARSGDATVLAVDLLDARFPTARACQGRPFGPPRSG
jgi:hypothetical protein